MKKKEYMSHVHYASAIRSLMDAMVCRRPDLAQADNVVSRYMGNQGRDIGKLLNVCSCTLRVFYQQMLVS